MTSRIPKVGQRAQAFGHVGVHRKPGETLQHVLHRLVEVPVEVLAVESHAQQLSTESGERLGHTGSRQGEPVTQQLGEPALRQSFGARAKATIFVSLRLAYPTPRRTPGT